jgi:SAM-dependent methyltransferase
MKRLYAAFRKSPWLACQVAIDRVADWKEERRLNIRTAGLTPIETLMDNWEGNHDYAPTSIRAFRTFLQHIDIAPGRDVFVDFGSGKGRVLVLAAHYPFKRVIGVEVAPAMIADAQANLRRAKLPSNHPNIDIWEGSAEMFPLQNDVSVVYLSNPFRGRALAGVLENIRESLVVHPRRLQLAYNNPFRFKRMAHDYPWLKPRKTFDFEKECIIYEADAEIAASCLAAQSHQMSWNSQEHGNDYVCGRK